MQRVVFVNGLPGVGKTVVGAAMVAGRPLTLQLDVDTVRSMLGGWRAAADVAGAAARALALAMVRTHVDAGHDVVLTQFVRRSAFPDAVAAEALALGAAFDEVVLHADIDTIVGRHRGRVHDVQAPIDRAQLEQYASDFEAFLQGRRHRTVDTTGLDIDAVAALVWAD